jgi:transposase
MSPTLACRFTVGELATLRIVGDEVRQHGHCDRTLAEIAARAGVSRSTATNTIRAAAATGLLTVQERRREGQVNLPNVLRLVSRERLQWLSKRADRTNRSKGEGGGVKNLTPTANRG